MIKPIILNFQKSLSNVISSGIMLVTVLDTALASIALTPVGGVSTIAIAGAV